MKPFLWMIILAILAAGCAPATTATPAPIPTAIAPQNDSNSVTASAIVVPAHRSNLSFVISGPVKEIAVKEGDVVQAGKTLMTLSSPDLEYGLAEAEAAYHAAEFDYQYWIPPRLNRPPERRQLAKAQLVIAQKQFDTARLSLTQTTLTAPFDATIISVNVHPGEIIQPGQVVITIGNLNALQIETTDMSERQIPHVKLGQSTQVYIEALKTQFNGKVTAISPIADIVGGDVVYKVTITLDEKPTGLLWGMNAEVKINTQP